MKSKEKLFKFVLTAILAALVIGLQLVGGIPIGPFSITLTLVPIVFGSITLGAGYGAFLGFVFGVVVSILSIVGKDPGGQMVFQANPVMAWIACLLKGTLAGLLPALVHRGFRKVKAAPQILMGVSGAFIFLAGAAVGKIVVKGFSPATVAVLILAAVVSAAYLLIMHYALSKDTAPVYLASMTAPVANTATFIVFMLIFFRPLLNEWAGGTDLIVYLLTAIVGVNFVIEFTVAVVFAPALAQAANALMKRRKTE